MKGPSIVFLVSGGAQSAMGIRARSFTDRLADQFEVHTAYRSANKIAAIFHFCSLLVRVRPDVCYVLDMTFSGVLAAAIYRAISSCRVIVDTGDAIHELSRLMGSRSRLAVWMTKLLEQVGLNISHRVVVRGHPHQELLARSGISCDVIPDGVDTAQFRPEPEPDLRTRLGLDGCTTIGLLGSLVWSPRWSMCYGWEVVEVIQRLRDQPVKGVIIGDGSGLPYLKRQCAAYGIEDRLVFLGRVDYNELPRLLNVMDICLSTQTNDTPGQVRTTGKLPLYLASGRFVLATEVGEAARVLPPEMLLPYNGTKDCEYPARLADRVQWLLQRPELLRQSAASVAIARAHFDYDALAIQLRQTIAGLLPPRLRNQEQASLAGTQIGPRGGSGI